MSILSALSRPGHLDDAALSQLWSERAAGHSSMGTGHPHLAGCADCRARYVSFTAWLEGTREDAVAECDALFPPERLAAQQAQILRRLEAVERPARVIAFPRLPQPAAVVSRGSQRWIAAAVAGLIVGLGAGGLLELRRDVPRISVERSAADQLAGPAVGLLPPGAGGDSAFLDDADSAITSPHVEALQALDAITPRFRDLDQGR